MSITIFGIKNCDTMKKAFAWLDEHGVAYVFHDYKKQGVAKADLERWCKALGWEKVLNRAGTTFRKLAEDRQKNLDQTKAIGLMLEQPSMIKRPIIEGEGILDLGFKPERYASIFKT
ncbi:MAG: ArsC family reductase [Alphaproteobacteria bacterium]|nr:ArsC family reductase [Alphaproteobacteria bacterium]